MNDNILDGVKQERDDAIRQTLRVVFEVLASLDDITLDFVLVHGKSGAMEAIGHYLRNTNGYFTGQPYLEKTLIGQHQSYLLERAAEHERERVREYNNRTIPFNFGGRRGNKVWLDMHDDLNGSYRLELRFDSKEAAKEWHQQYTDSGWRYEAEYDVDKYDGGLLVWELLHLMKSGIVSDKTLPHLPVDPQEF